MKKMLVLLEIGVVLAIGVVLLVIAWVRFSRENDDDNSGDWWKWGV